MSKTKRPQRFAGYVDRTEGKVQQPKRKPLLPFNVAWAELQRRAAERGRK